MADSHLDESDVTGLTALNGTTPVWPAKVGVCFMSATFEVDRRHRNTSLTRSKDRLRINMCITLNMHT
jgi:hypothetical protein